MKTAKLFMNGKSQAVRLPKEFRFEGDEVGIKKVGDTIYLFPIDEDAKWENFISGLNSVSDDFFAEGRIQGEQAPREAL